MGLVIIAYAVADSACSFGFGIVIKKVGRVPIFILGSVINLAVIAVLFHWTPRPDQIHVVFILAALWGVSDAVWQTQINGTHFLFYIKPP